jgi:hypothetical protein
MLTWRLRIQVMSQSGVGRPVFGLPDVGLKSAHRNGVRRVDRPFIGTQLPYQTYPRQKVKVVGKK